MNKNHRNNEAGQVLLITIMLLATALTVALSVSYKSTTETQVTKLEEESQKALAAAEAGIEAALKETGGETVEIGDLPGDLSGYTGDAACPETYDKNYFVSPLLSKDEQYTFYLSDYPGLTNYWSGYLDFYFESESLGDPVAVELTFFNAGTTTAVIHYLIDPDDIISAVSGKTNCYTGTYALGNARFKQKTVFPFYITNTKIITVRVLSAETETRIGIKGNQILHSQGRNCISNVTSSNGVTQKVNLFQSYPQIPAEFFVTSF